MRYAIRTTVSAPIEFYDAVHAEVLRRSHGELDGLLLHIGLPSAEGFPVIEVWESRAACQRVDEEVIRPVIEDLSSGQPGPAPAMTVDEFALHGLVLPGRRIVS